MGHRIVFIGAGNLATCLSVELKRQGHIIEQVYSRTHASAHALAKLLKCRYTLSPGEIIPDADIYFVVLKDSAFDDVLSQISCGNWLLVHCSGSLPITVLNQYSQNTGVFYPLQTFSKRRKVLFKNIPVFIEGNSEKNETLLLQLAQKLSDKVSVLDSGRRQFLHISAVFACNFVNHFYTIASEILNVQEIPFEVLRPLIEETARKVMTMKPGDAQTGPAVRYDRNIILSHLDALSPFPDFKAIYREMSESIYKYHKQS